MAKQRIDERSPDPQRPWAHLGPILDALIAEGNELRTPFTQTRDDITATLRRPINMALVAEQFELPPNVELSPERDIISDTMSWATISGQGNWLRTHLAWMAREFAELERGEDGFVALSQRQNHREPWAYLAPIAGALCAAGNELDQVDWLQPLWGHTCTFRVPLDFALVRDTFVVPDDVVLDEASGHVNDSHSGLFIAGPQ